MSAETERNDWCQLARASTKRLLPSTRDEREPDTLLILENTAKQRRVSMKKHLCLFILLLLALALPCALADAT
ncbi:MAG: hypothetical protein MR219_02725, partial [Clostridiales bacterium]|nr:hypothetical protein [Clostridiales bacterium]